MAVRKSGRDAIIEKKDPGIAAIISAVCMLLLGAPAVGYFFIGDAKKGIEYLIAAWALAIGVGVVYLFAAISTYGIGFCCLPVFLIPIVFDLLIVWDVYLQANGEPTKLPRL